MEDAEEQILYIAPDVELSDEEFLIAENYLLDINKNTQEFRRQLNNSTKTIYPVEELAVSIGHWAYLNGFLTDLQQILGDTLENNSQVGDTVLRLSGAMASYTSITEQMYMLFLNVFQITRDIYQDQTITNSVADAASKLVTDRGGRLPDYSTEQLEFNFSDCS